MEILEKNRCTGCGGCYNKCPADAIKMKADEWGFLYPKIDENVCIYCNLCRQVCPILNKREAVCQKNEVFAAYSLDKKVRYESTSGGIFTEIATWILENGGAVIGAKYGKNHLAEHFMINTVKELALLRQSKYVQSDKGFIYQQAKKVLEDKRKLLFVGTPCETNALYCFLNKEYDNLYLCDFICRGANSPNVYLKFLKELEEKYHSKVSKVWFKNKEISWETFSTRVEFENGQVYSKTRDEDWFIKGYIGKCLYVRKSCTDCQFKGCDKISDLTLGDYWGIKEENKSIDVQNGVSVILINSEKGSKLFEQIKEKIYWKQGNLENVIKNNGCLVESVITAEETSKFMKRMNQFGFEKTMEYFFHDNLYLKTKNKLVKIAKGIIKIN